MLCVLFAMLALYGVYSYTHYGSRWFSVSANTWLRSAKKDVVPGDIYDINGVLLAGSDVTAGEDGLSVSRRYHQDAAVRAATVHVIGDAAGNVSNGVETFMARALYGFEQSISERLGDAMAGRQRKGDSLTLTVDSALCRYISGRVGEIRLPVNEDGTRPPLCGAVVVMNWKTGAVLAEMSFPSFDPAARGSSAGEPYFNRAVQGRYAPGSTFKVVTAAAALSDPGLNGRSFTCTGALEARDRTGSTRLITDAGTDAEILVTHGQIDLARAFRVSCNNTFATAALQLTDAKLRKQAMNFGFEENFLFRDIVVENSSYPEGERSEWDVAMTGIGQSGLLATPMHLCLIAASVANYGVMMEPRLLARATASNGSIRRVFESRAARTAVSDPTVLAALRGMMYDVVNAENGTGSRAALADWPVYGKTGSAEVDGQARTNALFIGFIGDDRAPYALSIVLENTGSGGAFAAPLAHDIFEYLTKVDSVGVTVHGVNSDRKGDSRPPFGTPLSDLPVAPLGLPGGKSAR